MIIAIYGAGYVGLVSAVCLSYLGHKVICADVNSELIKTLAQGKPSIYEDQLPLLLTQQLQKGLFFTSDLDYAIEKANIHIIATGTPCGIDGKTDLEQVFAVTNLIAYTSTKPATIVIKSTVPVGTGDLIEKNCQQILSKKQISINIVSNPEFLREGTAISDFLNANRIIVGGEELGITQLKKIYEPLIKKNIPFIAMTRREAELSKYAANAMLACRISFINQISQIAEACQANIDEISQAIGLDPRIGPHFLQAGMGYGGSCFPKDLRALAHMGTTLGVQTSLIDAIEEINNEQKNWGFRQLLKYFHNNLAGLTIGIWGIAFKPETDDVREASSIILINSLMEAGAKLHLFDPCARSNAQKLWKNHPNMTWCLTKEEVVAQHVDALVIATEWKEFKNVSLDWLKQRLNTSPLFDGRNCFNLAAIKEAQLIYYSVGRPIIGSNYE